MKISFARDDWADYITCTNERTILKRINHITEETARARYPASAALPGRPPETLLEPVLTCPNSFVRWLRSA